MLKVFKLLTKFFFLIWADALYLENNGYLKKKYPLLNLFIQITFFALIGLCSACNFTVIQTVIFTLKTNLTAIINWFTAHGFYFLAKVLKSLFGHDSLWTRENS